MEFTKVLSERRSVRKYSAAPTHEELVAILRSAQMAPSWKNSQTTRWYAIESPEKLEQIRLALHTINQQKVVNADMIVSTYVRNIAGFTKAESEELRKALNKRDSFKSHQFEQLFYERGKKNGYNAGDLQTIWTQWYEVFGYNFKKAQAVSYALLAYQSAYLKANYREEYEKAITHVKMKRSDFSL